MNEPVQSVAVTTTVRFYDGRTSRPYDALMSHVQGTDMLTIQTDAVIHQFALQDGRLRGAIGQTPPAIEFPNEVRIELLNMNLPSWLNDVGQRDSKLNWIKQLWLHKVWQWERSPTWILASIAFTILFGFVIVRYGIPAFATQTAYALPEHTLDNLGKQALAQFDESFLKPSHLSVQRQNQLRQDYDHWIKGTPSQNIIFREGGLLGANAFALPDGTIVVTDELVSLSKQDFEILAVLAHETGHLARRHALRQAITGASLGVLMIAVTGDSSDLMSSIPTALIGMTYSRGFEREADDYAYQQMTARGIPLHYFSDILVRLEQQREAKKGDLAKSGFKDYLSTHPPTEERILRFKK